MTDDLFSFGPSEEAPTPVEAAPAPQVAAAPANDGFCRDVAAQDAMRGGFDAATQQRVAAQSYAQCLALAAR